MKTIISNALVKKLQPQESPFEIRDEQLKGLLLRVQPTGRMTYYVEYARGKRFKIGLHPAITPAQARDIAKDILGKAYQGEDPALAKLKSKQHTLASFAHEVYKPWADTHLKSSSGIMARLKSGFPDFQNKNLDEITPWIVEKWRSGLLKAGKKPATINRYLADLKSCLAKAVQWGFIAQHPIQLVKLSKVDSFSAPRFLTESEENRLRKAMDEREEGIRAQRDRYNEWRKQRHLKPISDLRQCAFADHLKPLALVSLNTGMRRGELFNLQWSAIDFDNELLTIHGDGAKSGKTRHIPLNAEALSVLRQWRGQAIDNPLAFPGKDGNRLDNVKKSWGSLLKNAGITDFRWHDMRHTFASNLVMAGVDLNTVRELLGHSDYTMTLRYAHLAPKHKADAVAKLVRG